MRQGHMLHAEVVVALGLLAEVLHWHIDRWCAESRSRNNSGQIAKKDASIV